MKSFEILRNSGDRTSKYSGGGVSNEDCVISDRFGQCSGTFTDANRRPLQQVCDEPDGQHYSDAIRRP